MHVSMCAHMQTKCTHYIDVYHVMIMITLTNIYRHVHTYLHVSILFSLLFFLINILIIGVCPFVQLFLYGWINMSVWVCVAWKLSISCICSLMMCASLFLSPSPSSSPLPSPPPRTFHSVLCSIQYNLCDVFWYIS